MITADDLVLCLHPGETHELRDVIAYARRFAIPLVAMVRRESSVLADAADIAIILPEVPEASPIGVPTTSTTMMLAYGDALAIALLTKKASRARILAYFTPAANLAHTRPRRGPHAPGERTASGCGNDADHHQ